MAITVHGDSISGNCWKVTTILRVTGRDFAWVETDVRVSGTRTPAFLAMNPNGKVPIAVLDDGQVITDSNAILLHFAEGTNWLPPPSVARTRSGCSSSSTATSPPSLLLASLSRI
jgi:glutathione S-transferase